MTARGYAFLCPHCFRKLRADQPVAGVEVRCSLCHGIFIGPSPKVARKFGFLSRDGSKCPCGNTIEVKRRSEDILVQCPRCRKWLVVPKDPNLAQPATRETASLSPVQPEPASTDASIEHARHIVSHLLPAKAPTVPGMDIAVFSQFRHEVGGDYYDFLELPDGRVGIAIGDVSGKGVGAAMLMVRLREILHSVAPNSQSVAETVATVNARLAPTTPRGMYVTFLYAVLDPRGRELRAINAGHCSPLVWRARLTGVRLLQWRAPALCILGPEPFAQAISEHTLVLEPYDCLCLYTDGVSEAKSPQGEDFGESRLAAALRRHADDTAKTIANTIVSAVTAHTRQAVQHDDMTLIILKAL